MPKRTDIHSVLIIGAGPIVIGQACEFDYSGAQACKALQEEGLRVILVNSNPATIMTDPDMADAVISSRSPGARLPDHRKGKPDALLPTMGGQTALNCAWTLVREGVLAGARCRDDRRHARGDRQGRGPRPVSPGDAQDRLDMPRSAIAHSIEEAAPGAGADRISDHHPPVVHDGRLGRRHRLQPRGIRRDLPRGLDLSPTSELLIEESILGWKEFEMEVVRDRNDNCIIVCSIENLDPMGVHTGDSITSRRRRR